MQHHNAALPGYDGPYFPASTRELDDLLANAPLEPYNALWIERTALKVPGHKFNSRSVRTSDGYEWHCGLAFDVGSSIIMILVPWRKQSHARSLAVYARNADEAACKKVLRDFIEAIRRQQSLDAIDAADRAAWDT